MSSSISQTTMGRILAAALPTGWLLLLLSSGDRLRAGTAEAPLEEMHTAEQIRRLSTQQADLHYPVRLRGVVTYFDDRIPTKSFRFIQDETAGIYFYVDDSTNNPRLHTGQYVEIEGETGAGSFAPVVTSHRIRILGETNLPPAKPVAFEELASGLEDSQFVEVRGLVRAVRFDRQSSNYVINLATGQGQLTMSAARLPVASGEQLVDSTVRVKGVIMSRFNSRRQLFDIGLLVPLPEDLVIERPAPTDPRKMPAQPIKSLLQYTWGGSYGHRVKVTGTVTLRTAYRLYIQDETDGLYIETRQADNVDVGDQVEVLGFAAKGVYAPVLQNGEYRRIAQGLPLKPDVVTPDEALTGAHDCRLVQIQATLLERAEHIKEPFLVLQADGLVFHAFLRMLKQNAEFWRLQNGSRLRVTGVCVIDDLGEDWHSGPDWRAGSFRLLLRSPADVVVLQRPPWWTLPKLFGIMGLLGAVLLTASGWVVLLRRRVHQQTQIIEEKLQAEAALKERYVDLFENANDMVFTHDLAGRMTSINRAGERLLQYPRDAILRKRLTDLIIEDQRPAASGWLKQVISGVDVPAAEWDFVNAAGQRMRLEVSSRLVEQAGRRIEIESIARDVTARKRLEREILEISNREQQRLGHDLHDGVCQQLAAIAYRAHIMARHLQEKDAAESSEAGDISHLINESLVQTRTVARGLFPVRLEEDGLAAAVEELTVNTGKLYDIKCQFAYDGALPTLHNTVATHLHFIAQAAILNAAKHSRATVFQVRLKKENGDLLLSVQDNGVGFQTGNQNGDGMGIGIMRYRAKVIGAMLELLTQPGQGTQVICRYHVQALRKRSQTMNPKTPPVSGMAEEPAAPAPAEAPAAKRRIFIVDDHAMFRDGLRRLIDLEPDLTVCGDAPDAASGLQGMSETKPDLAIVDISLSSTSGIDLIKSIKRDYEDMPVLVVSMHSESLYGDRALRAGAMGYVMKSEPATTVIAAIRKVLSGNVHISEKMATLVVSKFVKGEPEQIPSPLEALSDRELEVFRMLGQGKGTREIAQEMNVALPTVSSFKNRIKEKLKFKNSTEMILFSLQWFRQETSDPKL